MANSRGTRWRGKLPVPAHVNPLVRRLFEEMNRQQTTVTEVASRAGLRRSTISDWRYRRSPSVADLQAALNVLDMQLVVRAVSR